ncbi:spidroin4 [Caerostris extrusa]|uniref:Spidroin4 n=1 Tax=Caerostris extrusa TaxID=172846 RepID=A0AAV4XRN7_CAEEX|nr:spidroin4 [Caerostris extrusa]
MTCFTTAVIFLFLTQYARSFRLSFYTPFSDPNTSEAFARSFVNNIVNSGEFGSHATENFDDIIESLLQAQNMQKGLHDTYAKAKAMQMAFGSAIAELALIESRGGESTTDNQHYNQLLEKCLEKYNWSRERGVCQRDSRPRQFFLSTIQRDRKRSSTVLPEW